jgi:hypothetical protein
MIIFFSSIVLFVRTGSADFYDYLNDRFIQIALFQVLKQV